MKKKYRLLKKKEFKIVLNQKKKIFSDQLVCFYLPSTEITNIKVALIIPKKKIKKAVDRNYLKRVFWYINQHEDLINFPNFKCVFFFNKFFYQNYADNKMNINKLTLEIKKIYSELTSRNNVFNKQN